MQELAFLAEVPFLKTLFLSDHTLGWKALWYQKMTLTQSRLCDHNKSNMTFTQSMSYWQILKGGTGLMHKSVLLLWGVCLHRWWSYNEDQMDPLMAFRWLLNLCPPLFFAAIFFLFAKAADELTSLDFPKQPDLVQNRTWWTIIAPCCLILHISHPSPLWHPWEILTECAYYHSVAQ